MVLCSRFVSQSPEHFQMLLESTLYVLHINQYLSLKIDRGLGPR